MEHDGAPKAHPRPKLVVLRAGDAVPQVSARRGEFFSWIQREVRTTFDGTCVEHDIRRLDVPLPRADEADGFVITGSSSNVTERAEWMLRAEAFVRELVARDKPLFGICFGHQLVGEALGGKVAKNPHGREIGTVEVRVRAHVPRDPLFDGIPDRFHANHSHMESVVKLPPGAKLLAETELEPHAVYSMGPRVKCVQFHPEFDGDVMRGYVEARAHLIEEEGNDPEPLLEGAVDTPHGAETLRNFVRHVMR